MTTRAAAREEQPSKLWEVVKTLVYAVLIAVGIRTFLFEPFSIPSGSMKPTLLVGDYLFVSKFAYGYSQHSFPWSIVPMEGRIFGSLPERGDVAVFKKPPEDRTDYIKRIVGLPGDSIQVREGVLYVNDEVVERVEESVFVDDEHGRRPVSVPQYTETMSDTDRSYQVLDMYRGARFDNTRVYTVPEDHVFAMGDNRDNSQDSRTVQVGFVPMENLVGRAEIRFFSVNSRAPIWQVWEWVPYIRIERLFTPIK